MDSINNHNNNNNQLATLHTTVANPHPMEDGLHSNNQDIIHHQADTHPQEDTHLQVECRTQDLEDSMVPLMAVDIMEAVITEVITD